MSTLKLLIGYTPVGGFIIYINNNKVKDFYYTQKSMLGTFVKKRLLFIFKEGK